LRKTIIIILLFFVSLPAFAARRIYHEAVYQRKWCEAHHGVAEYQLKDNTRIDCLTQNEAVEFDFANKWAECIGQALHYGIKTGKKPVCVLIMEHGEKDIKYLKRLRGVAYKKGIGTYTMKPQHICNPAVRYDCPIME